MARSLYAMISLGTDLSELYTDACTLETAKVCYSTRLGMKSLSTRGPMTSLCRMLALAIKLARQSPRAAMWEEPELLSELMSPPQRRAPLKDELDMLVSLEALVAFIVDTAAAHCADPVHWS